MQLVAGDPPPVAGEDEGLDVPAVQQPRLAGVAEAVERLHDRRLGGAVPRGVHDVAADEVAGGLAPIQRLSDVGDDLVATGQLGAQQPRRGVLGEEGGQAVEVNGVDVVGIASEESPDRFEVVGRVGHGGLLALMTY